jgi:hypothetical protein
MVKHEPLFNTRILIKIQFNFKDCIKYFKSAIGGRNMNKKAIYCIIIVALFLMVNLFPPSLGESETKKKKDPNKDSDEDGIPDYLDDEKTPNKFNESQGKMESQMRGLGHIPHQNWTLEYGQDVVYGAWIGNLDWNGSYYIYKANVPWVKIDNVTYEIPNDFTLLAMGHYSYTTFFMVYHYYSITIEDENYRVEIVWYIWKAIVNNTGKITMHTILGCSRTQTHSLFVPYRIDFDILASYDNRFYTYGASGWNPQNTEAFQLTSSPIDPGTGIKVKQTDYNNPNSWGGVKAWNNKSKNYLLLFNDGEKKGDPSNYVNSENTYRQDDLIWSTAYTTGKSPIWCGPEVYLH